MTEAERAREWQPRETAPKDGEPFIAWDDYLGQLLFTVHWNSEEERFFTDYERWSGAFTHWMPLPDPPTWAALEPVEGR